LYSFDFAAYRFRGADDPLECQSRSAGGSPGQPGGAAQASAAVELGQRDAILIAGVYVDGFG
jgi:hypothetical protein